LADLKFKPNTLIDPVSNSIPGPIEIITGFIKYFWSL
jgi:hypothetical protein